MFWEKELGKKNFPTEQKQSHKFISFTDNTTISSIFSMKTFRTSRFTKTRGERGFNLVVK